MCVWRRLDELKIVAVIIVLLGSSFPFVAASMQHQQRLIRIPQSVWRHAALRHQQRIYELLAPGLRTPLDHALNSGRQSMNHHGHHPDAPTVRALDPEHPVYNFLIEYYGLKGSKGVRRLTRWSPPLGLLFQDEITTIGSLEQMDELSNLSTVGGTSSNICNTGIVLEGTISEDFADNLHLRGASTIDNNGDVVYSPSLYFGRGNESRLNDNVRLVSPFLWYRSIIKQTLSSQPILHCYGLHEWAMQYQPENAPPPPSGIYQKHLPLRVSRKIINETVERKGVSCTHVDALRYFAKDALPLNQFGGATLVRNDQQRLEQSGCVHAHMDLLKMTLKLLPFCDPTLLERVLEVALEARKLDVAASPYDASRYSVGVVPVDTPEGRAEYRAKQTVLMNRVEPVRQDLLSSYNALIALAFDDVVLEEAARRPPKKSS